MFLLAPISLVYESLAIISPPYIFLALASPVPANVASAVLGLLVLIKLVLTSPASSSTLTSPIVY